MTVLEIVKKLRELKELLDNITSLVHNHASRHTLGGGDEVYLDASQITSGIFSLERIPSIPWSKLTDIPSEFPPESHTHDWTEILNKPSTYPPESHTHDWTEITNKPSAYPPENHTHDWDEVLNKPSEYPPSAHTHTKSDIVDFAHTHDWSEIMNIPTEFTPTQHGYEKHTIDLIPKVTSDPLSYSQGSIWFRTDTGELKLSPDGAVVKTVYPVYWTDIQGKPSTYPPEAHTHIKADITDFSHTHTWGEIINKPSVFPPESHTHDWTEVLNKPSTYPPEPHTHDISEITVGTGYYLAKTSRSDNLPSWYDIPDKPSEFPPEPHTHTKSDITDFSHSHSRGDVVDLFTAPFWGYIPDKPFETLGSEFTVSAGVLKVASVDWSKIANKPSEYPPEAHTHDYTDVMLPTGTWAGLDADKLDGYDASEFALATHTHSRSDITDFFSAPFWDSIPDKPSTYPPEAHAHTRSEVTDFWDTPFWDNIPDKPSAFPPEAHTHSRSDITDFFGSPFWTNIPDKPFSTLGSEFTVSDGELQISSVDWSKVVNKPSEYPPEPHTHDYSDITLPTGVWTGLNADLLDSHHMVDFQMSIVGSSGTTISRLAGEAGFKVDLQSGVIYVTDPDNAYQSTALYYDWNYIANKPSTYPPSSHIHSPDDITPQGSGSGLDADMLDGYHASSFMLVSTYDSNTNGIVDNAEAVNGKTAIDLSPLFIGSDGTTQTRSGAGEQGLVFDFSENSVKAVDPATGTVATVIGNGYGYVSRASVADSVDWNNITSKPSTYPPEPHTHSYSEITLPDGVWEGLDADLLDTHHVVDFQMDIVGTAGTTISRLPGLAGFKVDLQSGVIYVADPDNSYQSTALYYDWNYISNKPATYPPSSHSHTVSDITDIATYYAKRDLSNVSDTTVLNKIKNVDGAGSGLDADLLDSHHVNDFELTVVGSAGTTIDRLPGLVGLKFDLQSGVIYVTDPDNSYQVTKLYYDWNYIANKPATYPPSSHTHPVSDITNISTYYAKTDLSNVSDSTVLNKVKNVDGAGSGLDADLLDSHHAVDFEMRIVGSAGTTMNRGPGEAGFKVDLQSGVIYVVDPDNAYQSTALYYDWDYISNKPSTYPPSSHTHPPSDISPQGSGSGLDADTVDGKHASDFASAVHTHSTGDLTFNTDLIPTANRAYKIGSSTNRLLSLYAGEVHADKFVGASSIQLAIDDTLATSSSSTAEEVKYFRFFKNSNYYQTNFSKIDIWISADVDAGTGYVDIYVDGSKESTITVTATSETLYHASIDVSSLSNGAHTVSIRLRVGSGATLIRTRYLLAVGVL